MPTAPWRAGVAELVDAPNSKSCSARSVGSTPTTRTRPEPPNTQSRSKYEINRPSKVTKRARTRVPDRQRGVALAHHPKAFLGIDEQDAIGRGVSQFGARRAHNQGARINNA